MDSLTVVLLIVMVLIITGVTIYIVYDYVVYKRNVDKSFEKTTEEINKTISTVHNNINQTKKTFEKRISDAELENSETDNTKNLNKMDSSLKNYFKFWDNNQEIKNQKLYEHTFSGINPDLDLLTRVNITNGLVVKTPEQTYDNKNLKICNSERNCIQLNVNAQGFNITPDNVNNFSIKSTDRNDLAKFDLLNKSIYLGGSTSNSPLYIENNNVFIKGMDMTKITRSLSEIDKFNSYADSLTRA